MQRYQPPEVVVSHKGQESMVDKAIVQVSPQHLQHTGTTPEAGCSCDAPTSTYVPPYQHPTSQPAATPIGALAAHIAVSSRTKFSPGQSPVTPSSPFGCAGTAGLTPCNPFGPYSPFAQRSPIRAHQPDSGSEASTAGTQTTRALSANGYSMSSVRVQAYNPFQQGNCINIDPLYKPSADVASAMPTAASLAAQFNPFPTCTAAAYNPLLLQQQQQHQTIIAPTTATSLTHPLACSTVHESATPTMETTALGTRMYPEPSKAQGAIIANSQPPAPPDAKFLNCLVPIIVTQPVTPSECSSNLTQMTAIVSTSAAAPAGPEVPQRPTLLLPALQGRLTAAHGTLAYAPPTGHPQLGPTTAVEAAISDPAKPAAVVDADPAVPGASPEPSLAWPPQLPPNLQVQQVQPLPGPQLPQLRDQQQQQQQQEQQHQGLGLAAPASDQVQMQTSETQGQQELEQQLLRQQVILHLHPQQAEHQQDQHQQQNGESHESEPDELRRRVEFLMEMVGGRADAATCRDVLAQVDGDMERASHVMVELYCGAGGGSSGAAAAGKGNDHADGALASEPAYGVSNEDLFGSLHASSGPTTLGFPSASGMKETSSQPAEMYNADGYLKGQDISLAGQSYPQQHKNHWEHWDEQGRPAVDGGTGVWDGAATAAPLATAGGCRGNGDAVGTWEGCGGSSDPWVMTGSVYDTVDGCGGTDAGGTPEEVGDLGSSMENILAVHQHQQPGGEEQQRQHQELEVEAEPAMEEKMEELRIYFPNLGEDTLRTHLAFFNGDVQQALQLLSELHEDEIYRKVEMERQAESDAALARRLAESVSSPGSHRDAVAAGEYFVLGRGTADAEEDEEEQQLQQQVRCMAVSYGAGALEAGPSAAAPAAAAAAAAAGITAGGGSGNIGGADGDLRRSSRDHCGLKLLVRMFGGGDVDEELLAEVLENQGGNVEASRSALRSMGLVEHQMQSHIKQSQQMQASAPAGGDLGAPGGSDPWFWSSETATSATAAGPMPSSSSSLLASSTAAATAGGMNVAELELGAPLRSRRCPSWQDRGGGSLSGGELFPSCSASLQNQQQQPGTSGSALFGRHGGGVGGSASGGQPQQPPHQKPLGPIRMLASLGVDYQELGFTEEALQCIRVAFDNSPLRALLQRSGTNSLQDSLVWQHPGGSTGQPGRGLTHEEKQALWAQHRELPLALKEMQEVLRRGARAASEAPGSKRLGQELLRAASALDAVIRDQHRKASAHIYADMHAAMRQQWKTDLHAQLPAEVPGLLHNVFNSLYKMGGDVDWLIITGKGLHSRGDGPKIPAVVDEWLASRGLYGMPQPGAVLVRLTPGVFARVVPGGNAG